MLDQATERRLVFEDAASMLCGQQVPEPRQARASVLLANLGYESGHSQHDARLLRVVGRHADIFRIEHPAAGQWAHMGGVLTEQAKANLGLQGGSASFSGTATSRLTAFQCCAGEIVEYLSQQQRATDITTPPAGESILDTDEFYLHELAASRASEASWIAVFDHTRQCVVNIPSSLMLRAASRQTAAETPVCGCAAGVSLEAASMGALLEVVERDALSLWWHGGRPARRLSASAASALGIPGETSAERPDRQKLVLDISTELGIPVIVVVSFDREFRRAAFGVAAGIDVQTAARGAFRENCQMQLGLEIAMLKEHQLGEAALPQHDRSLLDRCRNFSCEIFLSHYAETDEFPPFTKKLLPPSFEGLADHLAGIGHRVFLKDISRDDIGIPCAAALVEHLQPYPVTVTTRRLAQQIATASEYIPVQTGFHVL